MSLCVNKILQKYHNFILRRIDWHFLYLSALKNFQHAMNRRVAFVTLGCKVNFAESSTLARRFAEAGFERVPQDESADVYVINSCSVTEHADKKCRNIVRRLHRQNPDAIVAVTGCYAQLKPDAFIGVDVITGFPGEGEAEAAATYDFLAHLAPSFLHVFPFSERPGTPAAEMTDKVPAAISAQRAKRLEELSDSLHRDFCSRYAGQEAKVLFENSGKNGMMHGFTGNYIRVVAPYRKELTGKISAVTLDKWSETDKSMTVAER